MGKINKLLAISVVALTLLVGNPGIPGGMTVYADQTAKVVCGEEYWVAARSGPGTNYEIEHKLSNGKALTIVDKTTGTDGKIWYKVKYTLDANGQECVSYIRSDFVAAQEAEVKPASEAGKAAVAATGTITGTNVYVRNEAGTSGTTKVTALNWGHTVDIIGETKVDGVVWYKVTGTQNGKSFTGWTISTYIKLNYTGTDQSDYADTLRKAGFPESYIPNLSALHTRYPNWKFEAVNTGLDWNTVIQKESVNGLNVVSKSVDDARKSTASGAYSWTKNTWTEYEPGWVSAHTDYIAYLMDPRNFLDETNIFQFQSLAYSPHETLSGVQSIIKGTFLEGTKKYTNNGESINYANTFLEASKNSGVSAYHLASRVKQEQGTGGTSPLISGTYPGYIGYYNFFNFNAYGSTRDLIYQNGLKYAKNQGWSSRKLSIQGGAVKIGDGYINKGQNTLYFEKFNVVNKNSLYAHQYMSNVTAALSEGQSVAKGYADKTQAFIFKIPVYKNMPSSAVKFTKSGNPNNYLKSFSISGLSLTPVFQGATTKYSVVVSNSIRSINVSAAAVSSKSMVSGTGNYSLAVGNNTINVKCRSQSGDTRTYTINVSRQAASEAGTEVTLSSKVYKTGDYITGVSPDTEASVFLKNLSVSGGGTVKLLNNAGSENTGKVGTGNKVAVYDASGKLKKTCEVVLYGDVSGDGKISIKDVMLVNRHILGKGTLKGSSFTAGEVSRDGKLSIKDIMLINNAILGKSKLQQ